LELELIAKTTKPIRSITGCGLFALLRFSHCENGNGGGYGAAQGLQVFVRVANRFQLG